MSLAIQSRRVLVRFGTDIGNYVSSLKGIKRDDYMRMFSAQVKFFDKNVGSFHTFQIIILTYCEHIANILQTYLPCKSGKVHAIIKSLHAKEPTK